MADLEKIETEGGKVIESSKIGVYELALVKFDWGLTISLTSNDKEYLVPQGMDKIPTSSSIKDVLPVMRQFINKTKEWINKYGEIYIGSANREKAKFYYKLFTKEFEKDKKYKITSELIDSGVNPYTKTNTQGFYVNKNKAFNVNEIKINKPKTKFEFPLMVNNQEEYDFYTDELLKSGKRWFINYDGTFDDISSIAWPYIGPDDDKFPFCIKTNYWKPEVMHAIPYSACKELTEIKVQAPTKYRKGMYLIPKNKKVNNAFYIAGSPEKRYDKYREEYTNVYPYNFDDPNGETHGMIEEWYLDSRYKIGESAQSNTNEIKIQSPKNIIPLKFKKILTDHTGWRDGVIYSVDIEGFPETSVTIHDDEPDVVYLYPGQYAGDIKTKLDMLSIPYESLVNNILVDKKYFSNHEIN